VKSGLFAGQKPLHLARQLERRRALDVATNSSWCVKTDVSPPNPGLYK